jgi:spermidine synthase
LAVLLALSGFASLVYELLWMRRFSLVFGSGALSVTLTLATLFGGMGIGGLLAGRAGGAGPLRRYAVLEALAALWALALPGALAVLSVGVREHPGLGMQAALVIALAGPPALALGATLPVVAGGLSRSRDVATLYAANTAGAVVGVVALPLVLLPLFGVRGSELFAVVLALTVAGVAWHLPWPEPAPVQERPPAAKLHRPALWAVGISGLVAMSLQVAWTRLAAVLLGPSIYAFAAVLAVFLSFVAAGAALGRRWTDPKALGTSLAALGLLSLVGALLYGQLPVLLGVGFGNVGPEGMMWVSLFLLVFAMAGAPLASGVVFSCALSVVGQSGVGQSGAEGNAQQTTAKVYGINTLAGVVGSAATGLWLIPQLGVQGCVTGASCVAFVGAAALLRRPWPLVVGAVLVAVQPQWDGRLYAVGIYNRIAAFSHITPGALRTFADTGWDLVFYQEGRTAAVAVGHSRQSNNLWLSINGKVDASTGVDMPTQTLAGQIPLRMAANPKRGLVVGLATGVTAGTLLAEGLEELVVVELEPAVVAASRFFDHVSGAPLEDPRTRLVLEDARAVLGREGPLFDVIVSEPSNPWITGVSNLFTREYWVLGKARLAPGGVFCQWVQLYGLQTEEFRAIVHTFSSVFPEVWLFETVPGADVLLVAGGRPEGADLPAPTLNPAQVRALAKGGGWNTDDRPRVELAAPKALHMDTGTRNSLLIHRFAGPLKAPVSRP